MIQRSGAGSRRDTTVAEAYFSGSIMSAVESVGGSSARASFPERVETVVDVRSTRTRRRRRIPPGQRTPGRNSSRRVCRATGLRGRDRGTGLCVGSRRDGSSLVRRIGARCARAAHPDQGGCVLAGGRGRGRRCRPCLHRRRRSRVGCRGPAGKPRVEGDRRRVALRCGTCRIIRGRDGALRVVPGPDQLAG